MPNLPNHFLEHTRRAGILTTTFFTLIRITENESNQFMNLSIDY